MLHLRDYGGEAGPLRLLRRARVALRPRRRKTRRDRPPHRPEVLGGPAPRRLDDRDSNWSADAAYDLERGLAKPPARCSISSRQGGPKSMAANSVTAFMDDPMGYFDRSVTKMHNLRARAGGAAAGRHGASLRTTPRAHRDRPQARRAARIDALHDFDDIVPLLFPHTVFKSYPASLLDKKRFDLMTKWLGKVTSYDLSTVDTRGCDSIDEWIDRLDEQTPLE